MKLTDEFALSVAAAVVHERAEHFGTDALYKAILDDVAEHLEMLAERAQ